MFTPGMANPPGAANFQHQGVAVPQQSMPGAGPAVVPNGVASTAVSTNDSIDYSITIPDNLIRWASTKLPQTAAHASLMKIPMGAVLRPLAPEASEEDAVDTVEPGTAGIVRCKRCRTYMNAFVAWSDHGRRWQCNICFQHNDTPSPYFCHLDDHGFRRDRFDRPELSKGIVEFIAPPEYMVRPPQEPSYFFVIDVSSAAVRSGMVAATARSIKSSLDDLPGRGRTKIGFITFDSGVHYYNLSSELPSPQMLVVSDLKELFVPLPDDLLVNLDESRAVVETFLDNLPDMFSSKPVVGQSCLGPALKAAFTIMKQIGGKMIVCQSMIPNLGDGALRPRDQPGIVGTPNEIKLLRPDSTWYKDTAVEFSRQQISVDMFLFPYSYVDFAALAELPKVTSGSLHSFPFFNMSRDGENFESQLQKTLIQTTAFEAVMRIRCTKGMRITNVYGNFFVRGTDLLALPNCNTESVFAFDLAHEEQAVTVSHVTIQAALLYTSSDGERRIRVMTKALPVSGLLSDVMKSIDVDAACCLLSKQALDLALKSNLDNARMRFQQICVDAIRACKSGDKRTVSGYAAPPAPGQGGQEEELQIPENLSLLPLYTLAMMKNVAFRGGTDVHPDERMQAHQTLNSLFVDRSKHFIYPRMFAIHNMDPSMGLPADPSLHTDDDEIFAGRERIVLPTALNLSADRLSSEGLYLLENGVEFFLWVGRNAHLGLLSSLFGVHSLDDMDPNVVSLYAKWNYSF
jgi:protein transport protein SEC24